MSTERNETNITMTLAPGFMVGTDDAKASVFPGSPGIRLERSSIETSNLAEIFLEFLNKTHISDVK